MTRAKVEFANAQAHNLAGQPINTVCPVMT